ncbi:MAG TPA: hypothetical protein V6D18_07810 [Thermosynechococcaceae cyanobacterium]
MIIRDVLSNDRPNNRQDDPPVSLRKSGRNTQQAQETIYNFLLGIVKKWPPEEVLVEFKRLFIFHVDSVSSDAMQAVYEIVFANNESDFRNTIKRCCYILVNNWDATRNFKPIQELIQLFNDPCVGRYTASPTLKRLRSWLDNFLNSEDYQQLKLFAARYDEAGPWTSRYTTYLLVPQFINLSNPIEQREAARALSRQLKDRFKFDLAMYIARSQLNGGGDRKLKNPTALGDEVLRLIKTIVVKKGPFSYVNLASIFANQTKGLSFYEFKQSLKRYIVFALENKEFVDTLQHRLSEKLDALYEDHDQEFLSPALILRTCNRTIDLLTTENQKNPSPLFIRLLSQGNPITLVTVLLKIILVCKHARTHLEARIAELIRYYENYPEDECAWVINFLEVFNVTFTIYAENVQYNLVKMNDPQSQQLLGPDRYRVFSQLREFASEAFTGAETDTQSE